MLNSAERFRSHPSLEALESYEFGAGASDEIEAHLQRCSSCRFALQTMRAQDHGLAIQTTEEVQLEWIRNPPRSWFERVLARLRRGLRRDS